MARGDISTWLRAGSMGFVALAFAATVVEVSEHRAKISESRFDSSKHQSESGTPATRGTARDLLAAELNRCVTLMPGVHDDSCERAWADNRRRFLGAGQPLATAAHAAEDSIAPAGRYP